MNILEMEIRAQQEADGCWAKCIRDHWLSVEHRGTVNGVQIFAYRWGKNEIGRATAETILATAKEKIS